MAVCAILEMKANPGTGNDLVAAFKSTLPETRAFDGCVRIDMLQDSEDADRLVLVEVWETRAHHEKYLAWRREKGDIERRAGSFAERPSINYFDIADA